MNIYKILTLACLLGSTTAEVEATLNDVTGVHDDLAEKLEQALIQVEALDGADLGTYVLKLDKEISEW